MRKVPFVQGEFYHIYNRGVDKRNIVADRFDLERFFQSMNDFNSVEPIGSIYEEGFRRRRSSATEAMGTSSFSTNPIGIGPLRRPLGRETSKWSPNPAPLVDFICYCINPNHYHFLLTQIADGGISEFMKRIGGYTKYFNEKHDRSGALFQGVFKSIHINTNEYLLRVSAYINLNYRVHHLHGDALALSKSSWQEYIGESRNTFCNKDIILGQFQNQKEYESFALEALEDTVQRRSRDAALQSFFLE